MKGQVIAVIPARGNSKGIPQKNIRPFLGQPLMAYTIREAQRAKSIDRLIVSTEARKVERIAQQYGAEVFRRPSKLAMDDTPINWVIENVLERLNRESCHIEALVVLFSTSPLRTSTDIDNAVELARKFKRYDSIASVHEVDLAPFGGLTMRKGRLAYVVEGAKTMYRRQITPVAYGLNGAIWVLNPDRLGFLNFSLLGEKSYGYVMARERSIDINTQFDWQIAECFAKRLWSLSRRKSRYASL